MKVKDIMMRKVKTLEKSDRLDVAEDIMNMERIRHLPVIDGKRLVGILSQRDLFKDSLASILGFKEKSKKAFLKTVDIEEIMTNEVITTSPETDIEVAGRIMLEKKIGCLPVVENDILVGIITETDILRKYLSKNV
ncbi:MAG: CBS domain-containing protein [Thermodesulfobacteriota bacterium]|nr:CBS domain-containing protein [Thermodesulfobacteriota bacterium]